MWNRVIGKLDMLDWEGKKIGIRKSDTRTVFLSFGRGYISVLRYLWGKQVICLYGSDNVLVEIGPYKEGVTK
jgi:hypothetical protein